jgi:hypothetical protein
MIYVSAQIFTDGAQNKSSDWRAPYVRCNELRTNINYVYEAERWIGHLNI